MATSSSAARRQQQREGARQMPGSAWRRRLAHTASALRTGQRCGACACAGSEPQSDPSPWAPPVLRSTLQPPQLLTEAQRESYLQHGFLALPPGLVPDAMLSRLQQETERQVALSCVPAQHDRFVYEEAHTDLEPRLVRLLAPDDVDVYWEFTTGVAADLAVDLLGPDVKFHHSKLNFKWNSGDPSLVSWHQDIQFWPHSNFAPLTIGVYLTDVDQDSGPMSVVPLSAHNTLHNHEDEDGNWLAILPDQALATVPIVRSAVPMTGKAGTVIVHNCRCVHGSPPNTSSTGPRPLLLQTFSPASCEVIPTGSNPSILSSPKGDQVIRGSSEALAAEWDDRARPLSQECNWMPDPSAVAFDWAAAAALLQTPRKKKKKS